MPANILRPLSLLVLLIGLGVVGDTPHSVRAADSSHSCALVSQTLSLGITDVQTTPAGQVTELQQFLANHYNLSVNDYVTGYFGQKTKDTVRRFQCETLQLCSGDESTNGWGVMGPRTRSAIHAQCGDPLSTSQSSGNPSVLGATTASSVDTSTLHFTVGAPVISRFATKTEENDNPFTVAQLPNGTFRGFTANQESYRIDTKNFPNFNNSLAQLVLSRGNRATQENCGRWLQSVFTSSQPWYAVVHAETDCNYSIGQSNFSTRMYTSKDQGSTWSDAGLLADNTDVMKVGQLVGEGGCTAISANDGYAYTYCLKAKQTGWQTIALRAPLTSLEPSSWKKWDGIGWTQPNVSDASAPLNPVYLGSSVGYLKNYGVTMLTAPRDSLNGLSLSLSKNQTSFTMLNSPLILYGGRDWKRPSSKELLGYPSFIDTKTGARELGDDFYLFYMYVPPSGTTRDLIARRVTVAQSIDVHDPTVKLELTRWLNPLTSNRWATTRPPLIEDASPSFTVNEGNLGYVLTVAKPNTVALKECKKTISGVDYFITAYSSSTRCSSAGYTELPTRIGWIYTVQQPGTQPLYSCQATVGGRYSQFLSSDESCEGFGTKEFLLGYVLSSGTSITSTPTTCSFNGETVASGGTIRAYRTSSVPYNQQCVSEQRTCSKGTLSGSYTASTCAVEVVPNIDLKRYLNTTSSVRRTVSSIPPQAPFTFEKTIGRILSVPAEGAIELKECTRSINGIDYFLTTTSDSTRCASAGYSSFINSLGWVYKTQKSGTIPLISCATTIGGKYSQFLSNDESCEGLGKKEWNLGYVMQ